MSPSSILRPPEASAAEPAEAAAFGIPDPRTPLAIQWHGAPHVLFHEQALRSPESLAVRDSRQSFTYRELDELSGKLAAVLKRGGVKEESPVAVFANRSAWLPVALLAALKAGGAFVILDPAYPAAALAARIQLVRPRAWVDMTSAGSVPLEAQEALDETGCRCRLSLPIGLPPATPLCEEPAPDQLASILFTSGSTGEPKAILSAHRPLSHFLHWYTGTFSLRSTDRFALLSGLGHDPLLRDLFTPLVLGATLCVPDAEQIHEAGLLSRWLADQEITVLHLTPSLGQLLGGAQTRLPALKLACFGGEALKASDVRRLRALAPAARYVNFYGATETPQAMGWQIVPEMLGEEDPDIGLGIDGVQLLILNARGQLAEPGEAGEICVRTPYLARGYLNDDELTAAKFVANPFTGSSSSDRIYRTGDLGSYHGDGRVKYHGRVDRQVKIRGFRVEPGEIENHLLQFPGVRQASVVALGDRAGDKHLVAFLIGPASAPAAELRAFLLRRVPDYCVPSGFQTLEAFPLTPNGKIDRAALVERGSRLERSVCAIAPRDDVEEKLAQIWREVLQIDNLGVQDNFFELGGHSLRATQVMAKVREAFHLELSLRTLFENPTIEGLARALAEHAAEPACEPLPQIVPDSAHRYDPFPLTDVQAAYWIGRTDAFDLGNIGCHLYREIDSRDLDAARFERAFQRLVERHDMMRAIVLPDGTQRVLKHAGPYKIAVLDLRGEAPETLEARLTAIREEMSHHVLPAEKWPLFDIRLTRLPDGRTRLHFSIDLLIVDALSLRLLVHELHLLYTRPETILPALELTFRDYVLAEAALKNSEQHRAAEAYWDRRLPELPPAPDLPLARNPSAIAQPWFTRRSRSLSAEQWRKFRALSRQAGLTPSMVLLGAFAEVLGTWSKNQRFTLNLTLFNRLPMHQQVNSIIGDFTSLVPLAIDPEPASHFSARAKRIQEQLWEDLDHRAVSGIQVLRKLSRLHGARANLPVVFTSVVDLYETEQCSTPWDVLGERVYDIYQTPQVWLDSTVKEDAEGGLLVEWDVVEELFPEGLIDSMFEAYCEFILRLVDDPRVWHQSSPRLVPADQLALRERVNDTAAPISPALLHQGFLDQAARNPDAIAVIASKRRVTYGELSCAAGALAAKLSKHRSNEISTNTLVAIVMEKGWEQAAAALGVLQSGAAYVPIDPAAPPERLEHLLHHAGARVALTQPDVDARIAWPKDVRRIVVDDKLLSARPEGVHGAGPASPENLAYVIYTSGSTGLPKGVMIDHRGAWNTVVDINQRVEAGREDRVLALSALNFDLSVYDLFGLLAAGGAIVIPDPGSLRDPASWLRLIENEKITLWNTVPALMEMLVSYAETRSERLPDSLRAIMLSGDWIPVTLPARIRAQLPNARQISLGGATEASIWSVVYPIDEVQADWKSIPYGRPLANQTIHALNDHLLPCPVWVPGQLYIGGAGLALGYWRDEEKTQASFIRHPLTGERLYRTGDLGRYLPSGDVEFLGREDFQVKILGFRIELGEIEATLMQHPAIAEAIVTARSDGGSKRLVGYFTTRSGQSLDTDEVRNFLKSKLPEYMVPSALVALPKLPLSPNGKIDRKALPAPEAAGSRLARVEPRSPTEAALAGIWKEILGLSEIGVHDHFLEIGGNSLQAIQILSRVCRTFQIDLSLAALFQAPTIAETAEMVEEQILDQLEQMSDEDAERLLNSKPDLKEAGR